MFLSRNKKNNVYPCKPQFSYIKVGFKGVKIIQVCFRDVSGTKAYTEEEEKSVVNGHCKHLALRFSVNSDEQKDRLHTMYWLTKLHKKTKKQKKKNKKKKKKNKT